MRGDAELEDDVRRIMRGLSADAEEHRRRAAKTNNKGAELAALRANLVAAQGRIDLLYRAGLLRQDTPPKTSTSSPLDAVRRELVARRDAAASKAQRPDA